MTPRPPLPVLPDSSPGSSLLSTLKTIHWWQELFSGPTAFPWKLRAVRSPDRRRRFMIKSRNVFSTCSIFYSDGFYFQTGAPSPGAGGLLCDRGLRAATGPAAKVHDRIFFAQQYLFHLRPSFKGKEPGQIAWQEVALGKVEASLRSSKSPNVVVEAGER